MHFIYGQNETCAFLLGGRVVSTLDQPSMNGRLPTSKSFKKKIIKKHFNAKADASRHQEKVTLSSARNRYRAVGVTLSPAMFFFIFLSKLKILFAEQSTSIPWG